MKKPFKTIDEQIQILESRGVETDARTRAVLEREGYYPVVNGYKDLFLDQTATDAEGDDRYIKGTRFKDIYRIFVFDRDLRMTFMRFFAKAEAVLKTTCAYRFTMAHQDTVNPYLIIENYGAASRNNGQAKRLIDDFKKATGHDAGNDLWRKKQYLLHYVNSHDGEVPLWVLMNYVTFGQAFKFFDYMDESMKNSIAHSYSSMYQETHHSEMKIHSRKLRLAYDHIKDFRNICAHDERFYCARVSPAKDVTISRVMRDMELVLTRDDYTELARAVLGLIVGVAQDVERITPKLLAMMGISSIDQTFFVRE